MKVLNRTIDGKTVTAEVRNHGGNTLLIKVTYNSTQVEGTLHVGSENGEHLRRDVDVRIEQLAREAFAKEHGKNLIEEFLSDGPGRQ